MNTTECSIVLAPSATLRLESFRLNNQIAASLHYLSLGRVATDVGRLYAAMTQACRAGTSTWFESTDAAKYFYRQGNELYLRDELYFESRARILDTDLRLAVRDAGTGVYLDIPLNAERLNWVCRLVPLLRPFVSADDIRDVCDRDEWQFVEQLLDTGVLQPRPLTPRPARPAEHSIRLMGHAGLSLETPSARIVFDPLFFVRDRPDVNLAHELDSPIDAVVISHPHWDHFNIDTLIHLHRDTAIVAPRLVNPRSLENVCMASLLRELGFTRIIELAPWESTQVGDATITATPFYGEQSGPEVPQDWLTYHIRTADRSFFGAVDSCHNSHNSMDEVMRDVRRNLGPIDVLFSPYSSFHYPTAMFTRRPFYMGPGMEQYSGGPDDAVRWSTIVGADYLVPYAGFVWSVDDYHTRQEDRTHRGSLRRLRSVIKSAPNGPLCVLEPGGAGFSWQEGEPALRLPSANLAAQACR